MRAEVTREFRGQPDNYDHPRGIAVGEILYGALAEAAVAAGDAVERPAEVTAEVAIAVTPPPKKAAGRKAKTTAGGA